MIGIELDSVCFSYPGRSPLFSEFSLEILPGEWVAVVGLSGAGKTTLIRLIKGLLRPQAGEVRINGAPLPPGEPNHQCACVFANAENQIISPVVAEDVAFGLENAGYDPEDTGVRVKEALEWVGLGDRAGDFSHLLSGGEQQRLILAGALAARKGCLLLDDPLCMVDGKTRAEMLRVLEYTRRRDGCTVVYTTHLVDEALGAGRLVGIEGGSLVFDGSPRELLRDPSLVERLALEVPAVARLGGMLAEGGVVEAAGMCTVDEVLDLVRGSQR
jgi:energy-coupling factor transport system ATP-binding protein